MDVTFPTYIASTHGCYISDIDMQNPMLSLAVCVTIDNACLIPIDSHQ
jgi:hypothetical protein